jgi:hypothetical protein
MADFILSVPAVKSAYDTFVTAQAATVAAQAAVDAIVAPVRPVDVVNSSDWNTYVANYDAYVSSLAAAKATLVTDTNTQRTAELAVIAAMGYNTGDTPYSICLDQWIHVVGSGSGPLEYSVYIGASVNSTYLTVISSTPTQAYPLY